MVAKGGASSHATGEKLVKIRTLVKSQAVSANLSLGDKKESGRYEARND